jgi:hypothetical protein
MRKYRVPLVRALDALLVDAFGGRRAPQSIDPAVAIEALGADKAYSVFILSQAHLGALFGGNRLLCVFDISRAQLLRCAPARAVNRGHARSRL